MSSRAGRDAGSSGTRSEEAEVWKNQLGQSPGEQNGAFFPKTERWRDSPSAPTQAIRVNPWERGGQWPFSPAFQRVKMIHQSRGRAAQGIFWLAE